jgi:hypothetical protein
VIIDDPDLVRVGVFGGNISPPVTRRTLGKA